MELLTEDPQSGIQLRIEADRQFEGKPGDSTLRVAGDKDGTPVYDSTFVETTPNEAFVLGWILRSIDSPSTELIEEVSKDIQSLFSHKMSGREAHQTAEVMWQAIREQLLKLSQHDGGEQLTVKKLAERFERAAARGKQPYHGPSHPSYTQSSQGQTASRSRN